MKKRKLLFVLGGLFLFSACGNFNLFDGLLWQNRCEVCELKDRYGDVIYRFEECGAYISGAIKDCKIEAYDHDDSECDCFYKDREE